MRQIKFLSIVLGLVIFTIACEQPEDKSANTTEGAPEAASEFKSPAEAVALEEATDATEEMAESTEEAKAKTPPAPVATTSTATEKSKPIVTNTPKEVAPAPKKEATPKPVAKAETAKPAPVKTTTETPKAKPTPKKETVSPKPKPTPKADPKPTKPALSHTVFDGLLRKYVTSSGKVNYKGFKSSEKALDEYLTLLKNNPVQSSWSRNKKMAYWINAYNAATIKLILDNYPTKSITNIANGKPWDKRWIKLGSKTYTLNEIENKILRPQFKDARIHFAVNCAAKSCPKLLNRAWTASNLNSYFEKQTKAFVNNTTFNKIDKNKVQLSKIFEWYRGDFGNLIAFLNKYSNTKIDSGADISFIEYDWNLNE